MSTLQQGQRLEAPEVPTGQLQLEAPPETQDNEGTGQSLAMAIPMLGSVGSIVLISTMSSATGGRSLIAGGMMLFAMLGFIGIQVDRQRKQRAQKVTGTRTEYLRYLATTRKTVRQAADQQRRALTWRYPEPVALPAVAEDRARLWDRSSGDPAFLQVRYGLSTQPLALELVPPDSAPIEQVDPACASALHRLLVVHRTQPDLPATLDLTAFDRVELTGSEDQTRSLARALLCSATAFHQPQDLLVAVLCAPERLVHWDWVKWLPHNLSTERTDAVGPSRMVATTLEELGTLLPASLGDRPRFGVDEAVLTPHIMVVVDGGELPPGNHVIPPDGLHGVTVLDLPDTWGEIEDATRLRLNFEDAAADEDEQDRPPLTALRMREEPVRALADQCSVATAEAFARRLTALHTVQTSGESVETSGPADFMELLGFGDIERYDTATAWRQRPARDQLRVPIGVNDGGASIHLDIKESAQQGMGPHGLVIGATGSGKSEFLRTLVLGLAMTHSSEQLNMVLVDFKGGATFAGMSDMPHVSAVITNLEDELTLVDRMQDALSGEMTRRQELLRRAGNYQSIKEYERARAAGEDLDPMPSLFIVVDEFSEMLTAKPEFIDLFVAIGRLGRSLGLHLLLASQRLEEGRLRGLESHLSYRIGLRTFSAAESRTVLGVPDAYELPAVPGLGYLKPDQSTMLRFKAAYVSGAPAGRRTRVDEGGHVHGVLPYTVTEVEDDSEPPAEAEQEPAAATSTDDRETLLGLAVARMAGQGPPAHQVWLPPLDVPDTLDTLCGDLTEDPELGLVSPSWRRRGNLTVPVGVVDKPRDQRRDVLALSLSGAGGHAAVVGGPRSGKSTLLRTLVTGLALVTTPVESQFYVLDFGGGTFAGMRNLPHLAGLGSRSEPDVVRRVAAEVEGIVDRREAYFRAQGIDSIETYRTRRAEGTADDGYGDVFLVVDGWSTLRADFEELEDQLQRLAQRGLTYGLHLLVGATRWTDLRAATRDVFGTRMELRLGDPMDSELDRKVAQQVPAERPGRGITTESLHFLTALPRVDGSTDPEDVGAGVSDLVQRAAAAWRGPRGPKLALLPEEISLEEVREQAGLPGADERRLLLGVDERDLAPIGLDLTVPHTLVLGDGQSGKSGLLRTLVSEIIRTHSPEQAQIVTVDYRRSLLGEIPDEYQLEYLTSTQQATEAFKELGNYLSNRLPGPDVTPQQLRDRTWWSGAEAFVLVDDYDLVASQGGSPLAPLAPLLAQARDIGLHLVVTRRSGGASRAMFDPLIQGIRDLAMPALLLSGSPEEGNVIGNVKMQPMLPGRGRLITRERGIETLQLAWSPPSL